MSNLTSYTAGATRFTASGTASTIDLSKLTALLSDASYNSSLQASSGGTILDPVLATLNRTDVTTDGTGTLGTAQISSFTGGTITANGGTPDYSGLTSLTAANLYANNGAVLAFPGVTSYAAQSVYVPTIQANGTGSVVDLSHLTTLSGDTNTYLVGQRAGRGQGQPEQPDQLHRRGHSLYRQRRRQHHRPLEADRTALGYLLQLLTPGQQRRHDPRSRAGHAQPHRRDHRRHRHAGHRPDQHLHRSARSRPTAVRPTTPA